MTSIKEVDVADVVSLDMSWANVGPACPIIPMEFNVVVEPDGAEEVTKGGIILTQSVKDADELAADEGVLVAISPLAFSYADWPEGSRKPQVGDRVLFKRYAGLLKKPKPGQKGATYRVMEDKAIMAVLEDN